MSQYFWVLKREQNHCLRAHIFFVDLTVYDIAGGMCLLQTKDKIKIIDGAERGNLLPFPGWYDVRSSRWIYFYFYIIRTVWQKIITINEYAVYILYIYTHTLYYT